VVVVIGMVALLIFVAHLTVSGVDLAKQPGFIQKVERSVDRRESDFVVRGLEQHVDVFRAQMLLSSKEEVEDILARCGPSRAMILDLVAMLPRLLCFHSTGILSILIIIINNFVLQPTFMRAAHSVPAASNRSYQTG
jgi:hypothetical protein